MKIKTLKETVLSSVSNEIYQEVDGFYVYAPAGNKGFLCATSLRIIADELDRLNAPWWAQIERDL